MESPLDNCEIYFYDEINCGTGKETGYRLPYTIVENSIKLLGEWKGDNIAESFSEDRVDDTSLGISGRWPGDIRATYFSWAPSRAYQAFRIVFLHWRVK